MGELLTPCLAYAGIVSTIMWLLIFNSEWYRAMHSAANIYIYLVAGCGVLAYAIYKKKYGAYLVL
jgi:hypothetical protein